MRAEGSSPPPADPTSTPEPSTSAPLGSNIPVTTVSAASRKRKRPPIKGSSPAPSDQTSNAGGAPNTDLLATSRADLSSRPILKIARGPVFVPIAEGSEWYKTEMVAVNRVGYRYVPAGINPPGHSLPCRTIESNPTCYRVSWEDRSPFLKVSKDGLSIGGSKGFRSARCNAPMREGKWYMEVKILHGGGECVGEESLREGSHIRLGWGRREAPLNGPVGLDGYSYGYRDKTGDKVALSRPRPYGRPFGTGDVVGMYISLPPRRQPDKNDPLDPAHLKRERIPIDLKGQEVFEILEYPQSKEMTMLMDYSGKTTSSASVPSSSKKAANGKLPERGPVANNTKPAAPTLRPLPILPGSRIAFFVNGEPQGIAFQDIYDYLPLRQADTQKANSRKRAREGVKEHRENPFDDGTLGYYPFISLFNDASVRLNPGPDFEFPPPPDIDALLDKQACKATPDSSDSSKPHPTVISSSPPPPPPPPAATTGDADADVDMKPLLLTQDEDVKLQTDEDPPLLSLGTSTIEPTEPTVATVATTATDTATATDAVVSPVVPSPVDPNPQPKWLPASERYAQFMQEEWAFDDVEAEEARAELAQLAAADRIEEDKRKQREKKRQQAEARRAADARRRAEEKARKAAEAKAAKLGAAAAAAAASAPLALTGPGMAPVAGAEQELRMTPSPGSVMLHAPYNSSHPHSPFQSERNQPSPSPLRHSTAFEPDESVGYEHSPAPTYASYDEPKGVQSGYTSENQNDNDMDIDHDIEALIASDTPA